MLVSMFQKFDRFLRFRSAAIQRRIQLSDRKTNSFRILVNDGGAGGVKGGGGILAYWAETLANGAKTELKSVKTE